jgi:uncharacterized repeat protein (TIGR01451 family)
MYDLEKNEVRMSAIATMLMLLLLLGTTLTMFSSTIVAAAADEDSGGDTTSNEVSTSVSESVTTVDEANRNDGSAETTSGGGQDTAPDTTSDAVSEDSSTNEASSEGQNDSVDEASTASNDGEVGTTSGGEQSAGVVSDDSTAGSSEGALANETSGEGQAATVVDELITTGSDGVSDGEQASVSDQTSNTITATDEEEDPVHIYYDKDNDGVYEPGDRISSPGTAANLGTVCQGQSLTITVLVRWEVVEGRPPDSVTVQMIELTSFGVNFIPATPFVLTPASTDQFVTVIIPGTLPLGTQHIVIYADVIDQSPRPPRASRVAGTEGHFDVTVISCVPQVPQADLSIVKSGPTYAHAGDMITYIYTVYNAGPDAACNVVVDDDVAGTPTYVSGDNDDDGCIDPGETWTFEAMYTVQAGDPDPLVNTATVSSDADDPDLSNNVATWSVDILHPAIAIDKSADKVQAHAGDTITYTIIVTNTGDTPLYGVTVTDTLLGTFSIGTLGVGQSVIITPAPTYTVNAGDPDPLVNIATASGHDILGLTVTATDSWSVDLIAMICGYKFYDANANGAWDAGEPPVAGFKIELYDQSGNLLATAFTAADGSYCFDGLDAGTYTVQEVLPPSSGWMPTTPTSITVTLLSGEIKENNNFGNLCLEPGQGGRTLGYWANAGNSLITDEDIAYLNTLNLYPTSWGPPFSSPSQIRNYLLKANAKNMWWMLSAQLIATILNVRHGYLDGSTLVCVDPPACTTFMTINDIINGAIGALGSNKPRSEQEYWKNLLDLLNNNQLPFVSPEPCPVEYPPEE